MSLLLTIIAAPSSVSLSESSKAFDAQGGTIGRGKENAWVLDDPERFLSSLHCKISSEDGKYFLTDLSTNGTFLNGAANPMGKGCKLPLQDGDKFSLGDYEFSVSLWNPAQGPFASPGSESTSGGSAPDDFAQAQDPFPVAIEDGDPFSNSSASASPFDRGFISPGSLFGASPEETDPFAALDKARGSASFAAPQFADPFAGPSFSDHAEAHNQQVSWPDASPEVSAGGLIPDDWDSELLSDEPLSSPGVENAEAYPPSLNEPPFPGQPAPQKQAPLPNPGGANASGAGAALASNLAEQTPNEPSLARQAALEKANAKIEAELQILKQRILAQSQTGTSEPTVDTSLVDAMGFAGLSLTDERITEINAKAGEVIREAVKGLMQVLGSRSSIKNEFRMNVTTIQPVENNPLKFSANVDDALENMFVKQGNAYMKPIEAVREGFDSIAEHQIAIIAGIRAAFKSVIERFEPARLEERFQKQRKGGLIPGMQKARNWELYHDYYEELVGDLDNSFQYLFGDEFVQAYEDQLRKLAAAKKAKAKSVND